MEFLFCQLGHLIAMAMVKNDGITEEEALKKIWMKDSRGLIVKDQRPNIPGFFFFTVTLQNLPFFVKTQAICPKTQANPKKTQGFYKKNSRYRRIFPI